MIFGYTRMVLFFYAGLHKSEEKLPAPIVIIYLLWLPSLAGSIAVDILLLPMSLFVWLKAYETRETTTRIDTNPGSQTSVASLAKTFVCPKCHESEAPTSIYYRCRRCNAIRILSAQDLSRSANAGGKSV